MQLVILECTLRWGGGVGNGAFMIFLTLMKILFKLKVPVKWAKTTQASGKSVKVTAKNAALSLPLPRRSSLTPPTSPSSPPHRNQPGGKKHGLLQSVQC